MNKVLHLVLKENILKEYSMELKLLKYRDYRLLGKKNRMKTINQNI